LIYENHISKISDLQPHEIHLIYSTYSTTVIYAKDPEKTILVCDSSEHISFEAIDQIYKKIDNQPFFIPFSGNCNPLTKIWKKETHHLYPSIFRDATFSFLMCCKLINSERKFGAIIPKVLLLEIIKLMALCAL
jgi:hypothetical protein